MKAIVRAASALTKQAMSFGGGWRPAGGYGAPGSPFKLVQAVNAYGGTDESVSAVFASIQLIANTLAGYPYQLVDENDEDVSERPALEGLASLMKEPVPETTYFDWAADVETDLELVGNSFWLCDELNGLRQPKYLERFEPGTVSVVTDKAKRKKIGYTVRVNGIDIPFDLDEVLHYRTRNPQPGRGRWYGMGVVEAIARDLNLILSETTHITSFFTNGARIAGVLTTQEEMDDIQFERLKAQVNDEYGGAHNAYRTIVAEKATDFKPVTVPPAQTGVVELARFSLDSVYKAFGLPEFVLGGIAQGGIYKMSEAQFILYRNMLPRARRFQERTTLSLSTRWDGTLFTVQPEVNEPEEQKLQNAAKKLEAGGTVNEARVAQGEAEIDDPAADAPLVPAGLVPLGTVVTPEGAVTLSQPTVARPARARGRKQRALPLPVDPRAVERARADRVVAQIRAAAAAARKQVEATSTELPEGVTIVDGQPVVEPPPLPAGFEQRGKFTPKKADAILVLQLLHAQSQFFTQAEPALRKTFIEFFNDQRRRLLGDLTGFASTAARANGRKGRGRKELRPESLWSAADENAALTAAYLSSVDSLGEAAAQLLHPIAGVTLGWDVTHPRIAAARSRLAEKVVRINETTRSRIAEAVQTGVERGYSIPQIANGFRDENYPGISGVFDESTAARSETIARTETGFLFNAASTAEYGDAGIEVVEVLDGIEDEGCADAEGSLWTLEKADANPLEHPNCVRAFAPVPTLSPADEALVEDDVGDEA